MGRPKKITFTKDELHSIGVSLNELIPEMIKPIEEEISVMKEVLVKVSNDMNYLQGLLQAIIDIQEYIIREENKEEKN